MHMRFPIPVQSQNITATKVTAGLTMAKVTDLVNMDECKQQKC